MLQKQGIGNDSLQNRSNSFFGIFAGIDFESTSILRSRTRHLYLFNFEKHDQDRYYIIPLTGHIPIFISLYKVCNEFQLLRIRAFLFFLHTKTMI